MVLGQRNRRLTTRGAVLASTIAGTLGLMSAAMAAGLLDAAGKALDVPPAPSSSKPGAPGTTATDYDAASNALDVIWTRMPLTVRRAMFVARKADGYGIYEQRSGNEFVSGETLDIYAKALGYLWKSDGAGQCGFGVKAGFKIRDGEGNVLVDQPKFADLALSSHEKNREFMLSVDLKVSGLKPGRYQVEIDLSDRNSPKTASFTLPFTIAGRA